MGRRRRRLAGGYGYVITFRMDPARLACHGSLRAHAAGARPDRSCHAAGNTRAGSGDRNSGRAAPDAGQFERGDVIIVTGTSRARAAFNTPLSVTSLDDERLAGSRAARATSSTPSRRSRRTPAAARSPATSSFKGLPRRPVPVHAADVRRHSRAQHVRPQLVGL